MKTIICLAIILISVCVSAQDATTITNYATTEAVAQTPTWAFSDEIAEYEVVITIKYNAVTKPGALVSEIVKDHSDACKVNIKIDSIDENSFTVSSESYTLMAD